MLQVGFPRTNHKLLIEIIYQLSFEYFRTNFRDNNHFKTII